MCHFWHFLSERSVTGKQWRAFIHLFLFPGFSPVLTGPDAKSFYEEVWHFVMVHSGVMLLYVIEEMPFELWIRPALPLLRTHSE